MQQLQIWRHFEIFATRLKTRAQICAWHLFCHKYAKKMIHQLKLARMSFSMNRKQRSMRRCSRLYASKLDIFCYTHTKTSQSRLKLQQKFELKKSLATQPTFLNLSKSIESTLEIQFFGTRAIASALILASLRRHKKAQKTVKNRAQICAWPVREGGIPLQDKNAIINRIQLPAYRFFYQV